MDIHALASSESPYWGGATALYERVFPAWEREPVATLAARVDSGRYLLAVGVREQRVLGFYILNLNPAHDYVLFAYLAVAGRERGAGLGTTLCRDGVARFRRAGDAGWLFVEAEARQAGFYGRLGFLRLALDYRSPCFDGPASVAMNLMALGRASTPAAIDGARLAPMLWHIMRDGYGLAANDPRVARQLAGVPARVALTPWPPRAQALARSRG